MSNNSRTRNTFLNFTSSIGGQILNVIAKFCVRTALIQTLGKEYLGINDLFSNLLSILSLVEFGFANAILFKFYEPLSNKDYLRINALLKLYKKVYFFIGITIAIIGIGLIPFLPKLIKDYVTLYKLNINAVFVYLLFLFDSVISYLFLAYKQSLINADQKGYKLFVIDYFFTIIMAIIQIVVLIIFRSYLIYLVVKVIKTIAFNIFCAKYVEKKYPFVKDKCDLNINNYEKKELVKDCGALFIYRLNAIVLKFTDNIIISSILGLSYVTLYSNYYIFYQTISVFFTKIYNSVSHSLGDLHTKKDINHEYEIYEIAILITAIIGGTAFVGVGVVADEFVNCWLGSQWKISQPFSVLLGLEIYTDAFRSIISKYRTTTGLFQQAKYRPLISAVINLVLSIILVKPLGIMGTIIGTIISEWATLLWYDPWIIHAVGFNNKYPVTRYYTKFIKYTLLCIFSLGLNLIICKYVVSDCGWISVVIHSLICAITVPLIIIFSVGKSYESKYIVNLIKEFCINRLLGDKNGTIL